MTTTGRLGLTMLAAGMALLPLAGRVAAQDGGAPAADHAKGKAVFESAVCGACHVLADAGAVGEIGPSLDRNPNLTRDLLIARTTHGQGAMPPYGGQLSEDDIAAVADYVMHAAAK